jgi:phosphatidate cytidylyltransferase
LNSSLAKRVFFGALMILLFAALLVFEGWLSCRNYFLPQGNWAGIGIALLAAVLLGLGSLELSQFGRAKHIELPTPIIIVFIILIITEPFWSNSIGASQKVLPGQAVLALVLLPGLFLAAIYKAIRTGVSNTMIQLGLACFALIYLGLGGWFILQIRLLGRAGETIWGQIAPIVVFLTCVKFCDIGAYFTGRFLGRRLWVPSISPKKTWEGFFGGIGLAVIAASLFADFSAIMGIGRAVVFGVVAAVSGQLGDLLESMLKRDAGSKDSAHLIPEFGGVLDLLDSVLVAAPFAYLVLAWH